MRRFLFAVLFIFALFPFSAGANHEVPEGDYFLFVAAGCSHCAAVEAYLEDQELPDELTLTTYDIYADHSHASLFNQMTDSLGIPVVQRGVPLLIAPGNRVLIGDVSIIDFFDSVLRHIASDAETADAADTVCDVGTPACSEKAATLTVWVLIGAALADSINPCAFAVLILLMTSMLASGDRRRALVTGCVFVGTIFVSYFAMGLGLYHALASVSSAYWIYRIVGAFAVIVGLLNLKDAVWYGKGLLMEVPLSWRPKMKSLIRSIASPRGAAVIALVISLFLLPCTSGPYIVVLGMLSQHALDARAIGLLALYNAIFVLPMLALTFVVHGGVSVKRAESFRQQHVRLLHAIAGVLMLMIGLWVFFGL